MPDLLEQILGKEPIRAGVVRLMPDESFVLSMLAEELAMVLDRLTDDARARVAEEAMRRPSRWSSALRQSIAADAEASMMAAELLASVGDEDDAAFLRATGASRKAVRPLALAINKRLAPSVFLKDLGPVRLEIEGRSLGRSLRRKVLGLLCYLASRPGQAASRDEAIEALWPDLGPDTAANSLHQTIYFMRRVFEPDYREWMTAGYVQFDGDVIGLNQRTGRIREPRRVETGSPQVAEGEA